MIIKVKLLEKDVKIADSSCWVFDGIERINYTPKAKGVKSDNKFFRVITLRASKEINNEYLVVTLFYLDENRQSTVLNLQNCVAFLCNDEGRTFDKLVC